MADRDAVLLLRAREFHDARPPDEQLRVRRIIEWLCEDPTPDNVLTFDLSIPPRFPTLYRDGEFYVVYSHLNNWTIGIWDIGYDQPG